MNDPTDHGRILRDADEVIRENREAHQARSWSYRDLSPILDGESRIEPPSVLRRPDGLGLFYKGLRNELHGDGEQGKGWVACIPVAEALNAGEVVAYFDWEDSAEALVGRLRALAVNDRDILRGFRYVSPQEPLGPAVEVDARLTLASVSLVVVDAVNEAMAAEGLDPNSNGDIAKWYAGLPRLAIGAGATVIVIDHVAKDPDRKSMSVGGAHKRNAIDGASYWVEADEPLGRGLVGKVVLKLSKDRRGFLRGVATQSGTTPPIIAVVTIDATNPEAITYSVDAPTAGYFRPTYLMGRVSEFLERHEGPATFNDIKDALGRSHQHARPAVDALIKEGHVAVAKGPNRSQLHTLTSPFAGAEPGWGQVVSGEDQTTGETGEDGGSVSYYEPPPDHHHETTEGEAESSGEDIPTGAVPSSSSLACPDCGRPPHQGGGHWNCPRLEDQ